MPSSLPRFHREPGPAGGWIWSLATVSATFVAIALGAHVAAWVGWSISLGLMLLMGLSVVLCLGVALLLVGWLAMVIRPTGAAWVAALSRPVTAGAIVLNVYAAVQMVRVSSSGAGEIDQQFSAVVAAGHAAALCVFALRIRMSGTPVRDPFLTI